ASTGVPPAPFRLPLSACPTRATVQPPSSLRKPTLHLHRRQETAQSEPLWGGRLGPWLAPRHIAWYNVTAVTLYPRGTARGGRVHQWALLLYKVPPEPTARRVYVWRKLKRLGAILLHDAVWVLPATPYTREQYQWLAAEIEEMEGSAMVWEARLSLDEQDSALVERFLAQAEVGYREILAE